MVVSTKIKSVKIHYNTDYDLLFSTCIIQIPSDLRRKFQYNLFHNDHVSICVNFPGDLLWNLGENENKSLSQCIIALLDIYTGITQISSQLTKQLE